MKQETSFEDKDFGGVFLYLHFVITNITAKYNATTRFICEQGVTQWCASIV